MSTTAATFDLADAALHATDEIHEIFRELRAREPLYWNPERVEPGFWSVTRYDDCVRVLKDHVAFSSAQTNVLGIHRVFGDKGAGKMLNATDGRRHSELRQLVNRHFTPRSVAHLEPYLRDIVREALEPALAVDSCDLVDVVAMLPVAGVSALLGIPRADWPLLLRLTSTALGSFDADLQLMPDVRASAAQAHGMLLLYFRELVSESAAGSRDDVVGELTRAEAAGALSAEESSLFFDLLMLGGNETTRHGAVGGALALAEHPAQWAALREQRDLVGDTVQEVLRWTSPSRHVLRQATRDVELHGRTIRRGDDVVIWHVSANRDERAFDRADEFRVERPATRHVAFGGGAHYCLGAALATLELRVFFDELVTRVAALETVAPVERLRSSVISGVKRAPVRLVPA